MDRQVLQPLIDHQAENHSEYCNDKTRLEQSGATDAIQKRSLVQSRNDNVRLALREGRHARSANEDEYQAQQTVGTPEQRHDRKSLPIYPKFRGSSQSLSASPRKLKDKTVIT